MTAPGWYPDPDNSLRQRYWHGAGWSDSHRDMPGGADSWAENLASPMGQEFKLSSSLQSTSNYGEPPAGPAPAGELTSTGSKSRAGWIVAGIIGVLIMLAACGGPGGWRMGVDGNGYDVTCNDGTSSRSGGIQGACSHHGGVR